MSVKFVYIEGNIGSGKSTLISKLQAEFRGANVVFAHETLDDWEPLLKHFYANMEHDALSVEFLISASRFTNVLNLAEESANDTIIVFERSLWSQLHCFVPLHEAYMNRSAYKILNNTLTSLIEQISHYDTRFILLDVPYKTCMERILLRGREGENGIPLDYLRQIEDFHHNYFDKVADFSGNNNEVYEYMIKMLNDAL